MVDNEEETPLLLLLVNASIQDATIRAQLSMVAPRLSPWAGLHVICDLLRMMMGLRHGQ